MQRELWVSWESSKLSAAGRRSLLRIMTNPSRSLTSRAGIQLRGVPPLGLCAARCIGCDAGEILGQALDIWKPGPNGGRVRGVEGAAEVA